MKPISRTLAAVLLAMMSMAMAHGQTPYPERLAWWADARFGMFIHWGPVSLKGTEISWSRANTNPKCPNAGVIPAADYDALYRRFNPTGFDAREWVRIAKASGVQYMVLTAKHCDGFLLWDSRVSDYNIMHTPFKRDVCAELARAAHEAGMRIGWYFSPMDWKDPDCRNAGNAAFVERMQAELRELLTNYGRIDVLWFDYDGREIPWDQARTYAMVKQLQPGIVINNRLDCGIGANAGALESIGPAADYFTPEQWIGGYEDRRPWESCMTLSAKSQWAWGGSDDGVKSLDSCLEMLIRCAGGDGNVLLNVGPMPTGRIAPEQAMRLKQIGGWLATAGESIRGTRGGPYRPGEYGASTRRGNRIYLHVREWDGPVLHLPALPARVVRARMLGGGAATVRQVRGGLEVSVAAARRRAFNTIIVLELDRSAIGIAAMDVPAPRSLCTGARATASNVYGNLGAYGAEMAVDGKGDTRWATDGGTHSAWLEVNLGLPAVVDRAVIVQAFPELRRVRRFALEYEMAGTWRECYSGRNLPARLEASFPPVTAQRFRLNVLEATDGPTIFEFRLYGPSARR